MAGLRDIFNSWINAPSKSPSAASAGKPPSRFRAGLDRLVSGPPSNDPLYLSNRTSLQKARPWLLVGVPLMAVAVFTGLSLGGYLQREPEPTPAERVAQEQAAALKQLPNLDTIQVDAAKDVDLVEVEVVPGPPTVLKGKIRNKTDRLLRSVDATFNLTDIDSSQIGAVTVHLSSLPPKATQEFHQPLEQKSAISALIREVRAQ